MKHKYSKHVVVITQWDVPPGEWEVFVEYIASYLAANRSANGHISSDVLIDEGHLRSIMLVEEWASAKAQRAYRDRRLKNGHDSQLSYLSGPPNIKTYRRLLS